MPCQPSDDVREPIDPATRQWYVELLEGRRLGTDTSMWQVPTLTMTAQAFLLIVITNREVPWSVATAVTVATVLGSLAAGFALWRAGSNERLFSTEINHHVARLGMPEPTRERLKEYPGACWPAAAETPASPEPNEGRNVWVTAFWPAVLAAFLVADVVALIATRV